MRLWEIAILSVTKMNMDREWVERPRRWTLTSIKFEASFWTVQIEHMIIKLQLFQGTGNSRSIADTETTRPLNKEMLGSFRSSPDTGRVYPELVEGMRFRP
jgi:hypothetical protein